MRAIFISLSFLLATTLTATAASELKALVIDGQNNHKWEITTPVIKDVLEGSGAFKVDVSTTPAKGAPAEAWQSWSPKFTAYDVVISNYNGESWPEPVRRALTEYVKNGGGFVSVHAANNSFGDWPEYNQMIGVGGWGGRNEKSGPWIYMKDGKMVQDTVAGNAGAHGPQHEFVVDNNKPDHPIMRGLPAHWMHAKDELYSRLRGPAQNLEVLASAKSDLTGENEPSLMVLSFGKGRVFHTTLGHADYSMLCRDFYETLQRGAEWAATGDVKRTADVPADFPGTEKVSPVTLDGYPKQTPPPPAPAKK